MTAQFTPFERRAIIAKPFMMPRLATAIEDEVASAMQRHAIADGHRPMKFGPVNRGGGNVQKGHIKDGHIIAKLEIAPSTASALADHFGVPRSTMVHRLTALFKFGAIQRTEIKTGIIWSIAEGAK